MHFQNSNFKHKMTSNPKKVVYEKSYVHEKVFLTRNYRRRFIKNLLAEKGNENL